MTTAMVLGMWMLHTPVSATPRAEGPDEARGPAMAAGEPRNGNGMRISGAVVTAIGGAFLVTGAGMFIAQAACQHRHSIEPYPSGECWWFTQGLWMAPAGLLVTSVGVPLLVVGQRRHRRWHAWREQQRLALQPRVARTPTGWTAGVVLRF